MELYDTTIENLCEKKYYWNPNISIYLNKITFKGWNRSWDIYREKWYWAIRNVRPRPWTIISQTARKANIRAKHKSQSNIWVLWNPRQKYIIEDLNYKGLVISLHDGAIVLLLLLFSFFPFQFAWKLIFYGKIFPKTGNQYITDIYKIKCLI